MWCKAPEEELSGRRREGWWQQEKSFNVHTANYLGAVARKAQDRWVLTKQTELKPIIFSRKQFNEASNVDPHVIRRDPTGAQILY